jgi:hypothetical protein
LVADGALGPEGSARSPGLFLIRAGHGPERLTERDSLLPTPTVPIAAVGDIIPIAAHVPLGGDQSAVAYGTFDVSTRKLTLLTQALRGQRREAALILGGKAVLYPGGVWGTHDLWAVRCADRQRVRLTKGGGVGTFMVAPDTRHVAMARWTEGMWSVWVLELDEKAILSAQGDAVAQQ